MSNSLTQRSVEALADALALQSRCRIILNNELVEGIKVRETNII